MLTACSKSSSNGSGGSGGSGGNGSGLGSGYIKMNNTIYNFNKVHRALDPIDKAGMIIFSSEELTYDPTFKMLLGNNGTILGFLMHDSSKNLQPKILTFPELVSGWVGLSYSALDTINVISDDYLLDDGASATVVITKNGSNYIFSFNFSLTTGEKVTGSYTGPVTELN